MRASSRTRLRFVSLQSRAQRACADSRTVSTPGTYDVVVAGAGPAGCIAAIVLARGGARVLLLDRARFPRDKLCGDTLNPGALAVLRRLALPVAEAG